MRPAALLFFLTGLVSATWAARLPAIQEALALSPGRLALAILALEAGAILGLPAAGALVGRRGSRTVLRAGFAAYPAALAATGAAPSLWTLAASLAVMAFANSLVDVAMNVQGIELERREKRPLLARLHAGHAFGVLAGGAAGTAAAAASVSVELHFPAIAATALAAGQAGARRLPARTSGGAADGAALAADGRPCRPAAPGGVRFDRRLAALGGVAFCAFLLDGAAYGWIAVHVRGEGGTAALAAAAFTAFALALALGRLVADRLIERHGRRVVIRGGAGVAAAGIAAALLAPAPAGAVAGWAVLGAGLAPVAPAVLGAAPAASTLPAPAAIAAVTTIGYLGSFTGPPLIGALAGPLGLSGALGLMIVAALAAAALA